MNQEESFNNEHYRADDYMHDYGQGFMGFSYPPHFFQNTQFASPFFTWYHPYAPYYQPEGYDHYPYRYYPTQPERGKGKRPGKGASETEAYNALHHIFSQIENDIRQRPAFYSNVSGVQIQQRARITWYTLRSAVGILKRLPFTSAHSVAGYLEGTIMARIGEAGAVAAAGLTARIGDFLIHNFPAYASNPALATYRAEQIVNVISNLL